MIRLAILDAYGVTLRGGYPQTMQALAKKYKRDWKELHAVFYTKWFNRAAERKVTQKEAWVNAVREAGLPCAWQEVRKLHLSFMAVNKEILPLIRFLKRRGVQVLLLSKNTRSQFAQTERLVHFRKHFSHIVNTWEIGLPKASEKTIRYVCRKFCVKPQEAIYIDDQAGNLEAAKSLGVHTHLYTTYGKCRRFVEALL
jgi:FMN phosphatase YigB (HAD superfamily)